MRAAPLLAVISACSAPATGPDDAGAPDAGVDAGAQAVYAEACPAGTRPSLGNSQCVDVGWHDCPQGFVPEPSGWGCVDVLPAMPCTGATRDALGSDTCTPIGDCSAAFPPAAATYFVNAAGPADATHFTSISAALAAAPAGTTVAVEAGTYTEASLPLMKPVTLVGRCAEQVIVQSDGSNNGGVLVLGTMGAITVSGFTLQGFVGGIYADYGSTVTVTDCVLDQNRQIGTYVNRKAHVVLQRSVVRNTLAGGSFGFGAYVENGSTLDVQQTALSGNRVAGLALINPGGKVAGSATLTDTVIRNTQLQNDSTFGLGIFMQPGATLTATRTALIANRTSGLEIDGPDAGATLSDCVFRNTTANGTKIGGYGVMAQAGVALQVARSEFITNTSIGIAVFDPGTQVSVDSSVFFATHPDSMGTTGRGVAVTAGGAISVTGSAFVLNRDASLTATATGTVLNLSSSIVRDTLPTSAGGFGDGVVVQGGASAALSDIALVNTRDVALLSVNPGTAVTASGLIVLDTQAQMASGAPQFGYGVLVNLGATFDLDGGVIARSAAAGLAFSDASGRIAGAFILDNVIGLGAQMGSAVRVVDALEPVMPHDVQVTSSTVFSGNLTRVSSDNLPLPAPPM